MLQKLAIFFFKLAITFASLHHYHTIAAGHVGEILSYIFITYTELSVAAALSCQFLYVQ